MPARRLTGWENGLVRAALGDYADEAAALLLLNWGHWFPVLPEVEGRSPAEVCAAYGVSRSRL